MKTIDLMNTIYSLFTPEKCNAEEIGFQIHNETTCTIGYATNLTESVVREAIVHSVDTIVTHHDAWDFMPESRESAYHLLKEHRISHCFVHLPLDDADFGTNSTLVNLLDLKEISKTNLVEGFHLGRLAELSESIPFEQFVNRINLLLGESCLTWKNCNSPVKTIGIVTGAGDSPDEMKTLIDLGCDTYFTGEKTMYTIQYAKSRKVNLIVGSHTFTELFGVKSLCERVAEIHPELNLVQLLEEHDEL